MHHEITKVRFVRILGLLSKSCDKMRLVSLQMAIVGIHSFVQDLNFFVLFSKLTFLLQNLRITTSDR